MPGPSERVRGGVKIPSLFLAFLCALPAPNTFWCNASTAEPTAGPTPRPTAEPTTPSCYDYCEAWFGAGTPGHQCYNCYGANKCVDVAGSHCYYANNGTATCTAAGHIYC